MIYKKVKLQLNATLPLILRYEFKTIKIALEF